MYSDLPGSQRCFVVHTSIRRSMCEALDDIFSLDILLLSCPERNSKKTFLSIIHERARSLKNGVRSYTLKGSRFRGDYKTRIIRLIMQFLSSEEHVVHEEVYPDNRSLQRENLKAREPLLFYAYRNFMFVQNDNASMLASTLYISNCP